MKGQRNWLYGPLLYLDIASATQGHVGLRAYRLTAAFIETYREEKFDTQR